MRHVRNASKAPPVRASGFWQGASDPGFWLFGGEKATGKTLDKLDHGGDVYT